MVSQAGKGIDLNGQNSRTKVQNVLTHSTALPLETEPTVELKSPKVV